MRHRDSEISFAFRSYESGSSNAPTLSWTFAFAGWRQTCPSLPRRLIVDLISRSACRCRAGPAAPISRVTVRDDLVAPCGSCGPIRAASRAAICSVASSPILAPRPRFGRGEIEIVDRRVLDDGDVARRVHAGGDRPHHVLPVARIDVVIHHDHPFGVHELAQIRPHRHHHPLGVAGIGLPHATPRRCDRNSLPAAARNRRSREIAAAAAG